MTRSDLATRSDELVAPEAVFRRDQLGNVCVEHREHPEFRFGNLLVLTGPPEPTELRARIDDWRNAFESRPAVSRILLQWETPGDGVEFARDELARAGRHLGLELDSHVVLHGRTLIAPPVVANMDTRELSSDEDWARLLELQLENVDDDEGRDFWMWRFAGYRSLVASGAGTWWGVFHGAQLAAAGGLFWSEDWARYQEVTTAARYRRRGLCAHLCFLMGQLGLERRRGSTLVIVAEDGSSAERIYRRLGFVPGSRQWTLDGDRAEVLARCVEPPDARRFRP